MKNKLKPEEKALFRHAMRDVKPLSGGESKILPAKSLPKLIIRAKGQVETPQLTPSFSDYEYLDPVTTEERLDFAHPSLSHKILRSLRRGQEPLEASLDLHGQTVEAARFSLQQFLTECQKTGKCQVLIIHGKGRHNQKPILKNKLNHWLRQAPEVLAFCSATAKDGGNGALYLRLRRLRTSPLK